MRVEEMLRDEVVRLHALESGLVQTFDLLDGRAVGRKVATSVVMLIEAADRHLIELDRIRVEEKWPLPRVEHPMAEAWRAEVERTVLSDGPGPRTDLLCVALLQRAVHLRIPCYESARLYALYAERPLVARAMREALEDEWASLERLQGTVELGVSLRAALGGGPP